MTTYPVTQAKANLERLMTQTEQGHVPIVITSQHGNAVLIAEDDWNSIQETLYLLSIPGMRDSIVHGMQTPLDECDEELEW
ncbi:MAG: type II toxin-antitoxin system Phd/YefM family antitoxin [bacterium]|nr:type II toxin-antitoxin system Phd/YefM family antitoxin [bacterium]